MTMERCCGRMAWDLDQVCPDHPDRSDCPAALIFHDEACGLWGLHIHDGGCSWVEISHCPWCGADLAGDRER